MPDEIIPPRRTRFIEEHADEILLELQMKEAAAADYLLNSLEQAGSVSQGAVWLNAGRRKAYKEFLEWIDSEIRKEDGPRPNDE